MKLNQVKSLIVGVLKGYFSNKTILDKFSESDEGKLLYNNSEIDTTLSAEDKNAIVEKEDGWYVEDKTEDIAKLREDLDPIKKYQRYVNTELDYGVFEPTNKTLTLVICTDVKSGNLSLDEEGYIILNANKKYHIQADLYNFSTDVGMWLVDKDGNQIGINKSTGTLGIFNIETTEETHFAIALDTDCTVQPKWSCGIVVQEVGRSLAIDPVEHVDTSVGLQDTPVGHIISHMGTVAPKHYLICDGKEYNILDYPYLAEHIKSNFGSYNYFGGDGETTFAVPDLRNEFLRGYHCGGEEQLSSEVGVHQDATEHLGATAAYGHWIMLGTQTTVINDSYSQNCDTESREGYYVYSDGSSGTTTSEYQTSYTSRPTNTSVLYCIKYQPTYYMNIYGMRTEKVLFEGDLSSGSATLVDSIENYDYLEVYTSFTNQDFQTANVYSVRVDLIKYGQEWNNSIYLGHSTSHTNNMLGYYFNDSTTINIHYNNNVNSVTKKIYKIIGIRYGTTADGTPPTGSSCSCPTYTDEEVNTAIDEILISNEEGGTE